MAARFSICIPNFNYERYLGKTIASVLSQQGPSVEVLISDNASTDRSVELARGLNDERVKVKINHANVGFAGNLDHAGRMAKGELMLMLSSDDLMRPGALAAYDALFKAIEPDAIVTSTAEVIDADDKVTGSLGADADLWTEADLAPNLPAPNGAKVYRVPSGELLRRALKRLRNPFNFLATAFSRSLYERIEGYGGGRLINPDKWFHWRLLGVASHAYFVDAPLFAYRWHAANQTAQQAASGALKYLVDEYANTFEVDANLLKRAGLTREELERAFVEHDIARHGLATLAKGNAIRAKRVAAFGSAAYPQHASSNWKLWVLRGLLAAGPLGKVAARTSYKLLSSRVDLSRGER
ncbi:MAG: glycosyltransferase family A protein [Myxococcaceae bacterium]